MGRNTHPTARRGLSVSEAWAQVVPRPGGARVLAAHQDLARALDVRGFDAECAAPVELVDVRPTTDVAAWHRLLEEDERRAMLDAPVGVDPRVVYPQLRPSVRVADLRLAIEVDNGVGRGGRWVDVPNRHYLLDGIRDDAARDVLYRASGWRVLRIRRPGAPTDGDWPWRIVTSSQLPWAWADKIAMLVGRRRGQESPMDGLDYEWRLMDVMAARGMPRPADLARAMEAKGFPHSASHVDRICHEKVERISIDELLLLLDILECSYDDLIVRMRPGVPPAAPQPRLRVVGPDDWA